MSGSYDSRLNTVVWPANRPLWRIHRAERDALWFGPEHGEAPRNRFDAPHGEYRICYLGGSPAAAFVETLLRGRRRRVVARATLRGRMISEIHLDRALRIARLDGPGMVSLGVGSDTIHGADYTVSRRLALEAYRQESGIDGLRYRSRWDDDCFCVALFDRAASAVTVERGGDTMDRSPRIRALLALYHVGVV